MLNENKNSQSRKWLLTINNPIEKGYTHDNIKYLLESSIDSTVYWCMSDETGENGTFHTHLYIVYCSPRRFSTMKKNFEGAHFDIARGTSQENRDYVFKEGKWLNDVKGETNHRDSHEEYGELPQERQGKRTDLDMLYDMIKNGMSNYEILEENPRYMLQIDKIDRARKTYVEEQYRDKWRDVEVTYIWGVTGAGKTRGVKEEYGYRNVYTVTDYTHPFDGYSGQDVLLFEEFRSSLKISDMLQYLDGYPIELPCRYSNKIACFTKVFICTNIDLRNQYRDIQTDCAETWNAFLRRIRYVKTYTDVGNYVLMDTQNYMKNMFWFFKNPFYDERDDTDQMAGMEQLSLPGCN